MNILFTLDEKNYTDTMPVNERFAVRAIGEVLEVRADDFQAGYKFVHHSYYFQCDVEEGKTEIHMTDEEFKRGYNFLWVKLEDIIENNLKICKEKWTLRDTRFLQWLREHN